MPTVLSLEDNDKYSISGIPLDRLYALTIIIRAANCLDCEINGKCAGVEKSYCRDWLWLLDKGVEMWEKKNGVKIRDENHKS